MKSPKSVSATPPDPSSQAKWWAMLGIGLGVLMFTLDTSIVNIALPTLVKTLNTNFALIQWVVISYLLVITSLVLGAARLGDMFGKKQLYSVGLVVFTISSLLCGLAPNVESLIAFRALQGLGAVFISALGAAIITEVFPNSERGRALGIIGAVVSLGVALGPSVGGLLIGISGWRTIFLVNVPIGIIASFIVSRFVPTLMKNDTKQRFDSVGALLMTVTLSCFALGMTEGQNQGFTSTISVILLISAALSFAVFLVLETRMRQPMLALDMFQNLQFSLSLLLGLLVFVALGGIIFILPFFLELVLKFSTQQVGLLLAVSPVLGGIVAPLSGIFSDRFGPRLISLLGLILMVIGCLLLSTLHAQMTELGYIWRVVPFGIGFGFFQSPNNSAIMGEVSLERLGIASGLLALSRTLGQTTGVPLLGALFASLALSREALAVHSNITITTASAEALVYGVQGTLHFAAFILGAATLLTAVIWRIERSLK